MNNYTDINAKAIDKWAENGWEWSVPITHEAFAAAKAGNWNVVLTPTISVPHEWFLPFIKNERLDGVHILGLASGGGQQMPVFSALGADCTVVDYSDKQLESEHMVAQREIYKIDIVKADMSKRLPFEDDSFDIIFHPVSNNYVEDVDHVWGECYRVLRKGGILLSGLDNGNNYLFDDFTARPLVVANKLPYNPLKDPDTMKKTIAEDGSVQFSHNFDEQIGGQLKAGFVITGAYEDYNSETDKESHGIPCFWATRAVKL
jgi:Methylase involved in ubiquinone/menaquinone biosynthesis